MLVVKNCRPVRRGLFVVMTRGKKQNGKETQGREKTGQRVYGRFANVLSTSEVVSLTCWVSFLTAFA